MLWIGDLLMLFFPSNCLLCGKRLAVSGDILCLECERAMPRTTYGDRIDNPVSQTFWGRVPVESGTSLFRFEKGSSYQTLLHDLKYRGNKQAGQYLGRLLGQAIKKTTFSQCDMMIPVPLHRKRERARGYNQSEVIARGASEITGIPVVSDLIKRTEHSRSQTRMSRHERFENMANAFCLSNRCPDMEGKSILIIDDVITTGATLEACSWVLLRQFSCRIYVATVSCA